MTTNALSPQAPTYSTLTSNNSAVSAEFVGAILTELAERVTKIITRSITEGKNAGISLEVEAGRQVQLAIQNAQVAFEKELNKVDKLISSKLEQLKGMVASLEYKTVQDFKLFMVQVEDFILEVLPGNDPRVTKVTPRYVVLNTDTNTDASLTINGRFKNVNEEKKPFLQFKDKKIESVHTQEKQLQFMVPVNELMADNSHPYKVLDLTVPWVEKGYFTNTWHTATYKLLWLPLPVSPGKITAIYTSKIGEKLIENFRSQSIKAWGDDSYPQKWVTKGFTIRPNEGWKFVTSQEPKLIEEYGHGIHNQKIAYTENEVDVSVELRADKGHYMGRINFHIETQEEKTIQKAIIRKDKIDLRWGESRILQPQEGEELTKIVFEEFDGKTIEFAGVNFSNRFVKIEDENGKYKVVATNVEDIEI